MIANSYQAGKTIDFSIILRDSYGNALSALDALSIAGSQLHIFLQTNSYSSNPYEIPDLPFKLAEVSSGEVMVTVDTNATGTLIAKLELGNSFVLSSGRPLAFQLCIYYVTQECPTLCVHYTILSALNRLLMNDLDSPSWIIRRRVSC